MLWVPSTTAEGFTMDVQEWLNLKKATKAMTMMTHTDNYKIHSTLASFTNNRQKNMIIELSEKWSFFGENREKFCQSEIYDIEDNLKPGSTENPNYWGKILNCILRVKGKECFKLHFARIFMNQFSIAYLQ